MYPINLVFLDKWSYLCQGSKDEITRIYTKIMKAQDVYDEMISGFIEAILDNGGGHFGPLLDYCLEHRLPPVRLACLLLTVNSLLKIREYVNTRMQKKENHRGGFAIVALNKTSEIVWLALNGC